MLAPPILFKIIHVISAAVLFGGILFGALIFTLANRFARGSAREVAGLCGRASYLTLAALIVQPVTGFILVRLLDDSGLEPWLQATYALLLLIFGCWLGQTLVLRRIEGGATDRFGLWAMFAWGSVALLCPVFYLMIAQPALWGHT